jgi:hypothetical protein
MAGENFSNYGVLGVPTLFLLDREGVVLKKTAMVDEVINIIEHPGQNHLHLPGPVTKPEIQDNRSFEPLAGL